MNRNRMKRVCTYLLATLQRNPARLNLIRLECGRILLLLRAGDRRRSLPKAQIETQSCWQCASSSLVRLCRCAISGNRRGGTCPLSLTPTNPKAAATQATVHSESN